MQFFLLREPYKPVGFGYGNGQDLFKCVWNQNILVRSMNGSAEVNIFKKKRKEWEGGGAHY